MKLKDIKYTQRFYLNKTKYIQVVRPKTMHENSVVVCRPENDPYTWVDIGINSEIKPVIRL